jgi:UDP-N-acetylmuramoyl-L-alanyl-D-glutamate--2,6-diaminopimelate ligase
LDYHGTFDEYRKAKQMFFDGLKPEAFALTNDDDRNGKIMIQNTRAKKMSYSLRTMTDFKGEVVENGFEGMLMKFRGQEAFMQFVGRFNASNLMAVYGAAVSLGFESGEVLVALSALRPVDGRFEALRSEDGKTAIVDYAHTPDALNNVISTINEIRKDGQQLLTVCGCGGNRDKTKRPQMAKEAVAGSDIVILTSDNPRNEDPMDILSDMKAGLNGEESALVLTIPDRREAIFTAVKMAKSGDIILVAGKGHEDYQEINGIKHHFDDREEVMRMFNK